MEQPYVIILANGLNGLGAVRSAAYAGLKVYTVLPRPSDLSAYSRYATNRYLLPPKPEACDLEAILEEMYRREGGPGVLFGCSDFAAEILGQMKTEGYSKHHLLVPCAKTANILNDKKLECSYMEKGGITLPKTYYDLSREVPQAFPIIIKPRTFREHKILGAKNIIIQTQQDLDEFRSHYADSIERFIGQEVIQGEDDNLWVCNATFDQENELTACFVFNRLGTMPSHYGVTSLAVSRDNARLREECRKIGKTLNYAGPAMIEFKKSRNSESYYYIETNPRLGMCNWFDTRCGVNNILACTKAAYGQKSPFPSQKDNKVFWNFFGDLVARLENRESAISIMFLYTKIIFRRPIGALFYLKDLRPAIRYSQSALKNIIERVIKKLKSRLAVFQRAFK